MQRSIILLLSAVLGLPFCVSMPVQAQSAAFEGTFIQDTARSDDIRAAIEQAVGGMNFITRPIARGRLVRTNPSHQSVTIAYAPREIHIAVDERPPIVTPADGTPIEWQREDGEVFDVSTSWQEGKLRQTFHADDGERINLYSLSANGDTLSMEVTVSSPRLPRPVVYRLVFHRER